MIAVLLGTFNTDRHCSHYNGIQVTLHRELTNNVINRIASAAGHMLIPSIMRAHYTAYAGGHYVRGSEHSMSCFILLPDEIKYSLLGSLPTG